MTGSIRNAQNKSNDITWNSYDNYILLDIAELRMNKSPYSSEND